MTGGMGGGANPLQSLMDRMTGGGSGGLDASDLSSVLRGFESNEPLSTTNSNQLVFFFFFF